MKRYFFPSFKFSQMFIRSLYMLLGCCLMLGKPQAVFATKKQKNPYACIVVDAGNGKILHQVNANKLVFPASLTKMMVLYLTFKALKEKKISLESKVTMSAYGRKQPPSKLGLQVGEEITVYQAILALVTKSANDVAVALAETLGNTESQFAGAMTRQAKRLGMHHTNFYNASGLPHPNQKTTAKDMAILSKALWRDFFVYTKHCFKSPAFYFKGVTHKNHNTLLGKVEGVDGMKTGYTAAAGFNLAASVKRQGKRLIVVVIGGKSRRWRDNHVTTLINTAFVAPSKLAFVAKPAQKPTLMAQKDRAEMIPNTGSNEKIDSVFSLISKASAAEPKLLQSKKMELKKRLTLKHRKKPQPYRKKNLKSRGKQRLSSVINQKMKIYSNANLI